MIAKLMVLPALQPTRRGRQQSRRGDGLERTPTGRGVTGTGLSCGSNRSPGAVRAATIHVTKPASSGTMRTMAQIWARLKPSVS